ncbi:MAG: dienelactone hydrolase family protein [Pseudomonadota bacterium]
MIRLILIALVVLVLGGLGLAFFKGEDLLLANAARTMEKRSLEELKGLLKPAIRVYLPEDAGTEPLPTLIQFHGCSGHKDGHQQQWADVGMATGHLVLSVDSNSVRGIERDVSFETVCQGKELIGYERAADIAAALAIAAERPDVDTDRITVMGWSHGSWTLMDYASLTSNDRPLPTLEATVAELGDEMIPQVNGYVLFYPYCGIGSLARVMAWKDNAPTVAFVGGQDDTVNGPECKAMFEKISTQGGDIDLVYYPDTNHSFEDTFLEEEYQYYYDAEAHKDAEARVRMFLEDRAMN